MAVTQEGRRRREVRLEAPAGKSDQRVEILARRLRQAQDFAIDCLFAGEVNLPEQPPHGRMKPEQRAGHLLRDGEYPVAPADAEQLVSRHGRANSHWPGYEAGGAPG